MVFNSFFYETQSAFHNFSISFIVFSIVFMTKFYIPIQLVVLFNIAKADCVTVFSKLISSNIKNITRNFGYIKHELARLFSHLYATHSAFWFI